MSHSPAPNTKLNIAIFISGRGSNMSALIEACAAPDFPARIAMVLSNNPDAQGLQIAQNAGLETLIIPHKNFSTKPDFENAIITALAPYKLDLICLAGFMRILSADFIRHFEQRIINMHPSLLPDYKGLNTHARAIKDGKTEAGCSVHYVTPALDAGDVIIQRRVNIVDGDTPDILAQRVLIQEHIAYPDAVRMIASKISRLN